MIIGTYPHMRRRDVIGLLGGAAASPLAAWPLVARAQEGGRVRRGNDSGGTQVLDDPFMVYMNNKGYNPIVLPKSGVSPPMVMILESDHYSDMRELTELLTSRKLSTEGLVANYEPAAGFEKDLANNKSGKVSVTLFDRLLSGIGLSGDATIKAHANQGGQTKYQFQEVYVKNTFPGVIRERIGNLESDVFDDADLKEDRVYIAYQYVYAKKLIIGNGNNMAAGFGGKGKVGGAADIEVSASGDSVRIDVAKYNGNEPLAFGFKAGRLTRRTGKYHFEWLMPPGKNLNAKRDEPIVFKNRVFQPA